MNEENQVTDDNEQGIPVKTPERDEHSIIRGINILLAGIAVGALSPVFGWGASPSSAGVFCSAACCCNLASSQY